MMDDMLQEAKEILDRVEDYDPIQYPSFIAKVCGLIESGNGFESANKDNLLSKLMLVVSELDEARTFCVDGDGDPLDEELADTAIRLLAILYRYADSWNFRHSHITTMSKWTNIEVQLWEVIRYVVMAVEAWRKDKKTDTVISLELALDRVFQVAGANEINLWDSIFSKCRKNLNRGSLHGKKRSA